ncbi:MAG: hypothetical protein ABWY56_05225 [Propionibacteriaceae bacterium]
MPAPADVFLPSTHGFHFPNAWPSGTPDLIVQTPLGDIPLGDASQGLCGGFCFTALDLFRAGFRPPSDTTAPPGGSPLVTYLTWRLLSSWNIPTGILVYYRWANTSDHDMLFGRIHGLSRMTIEDEIPEIIRSLDGGEPCTLGLVTVRSSNPKDLGQCHQVLAYGYRWSGPVFWVNVYDPNLPDRDDIYLSVDTSHPGRRTPVGTNVGISGSVRGFFKASGYAFRDPAAIAGPRWEDHPGPAVPPSVAVDLTVGASVPPA